MMAFLGQNNANLEVMEGNPGSATDIEKARVEKELIKAILQEEGVLGFSDEGRGYITPARVRGREGVRGVRV